LIFSFWRNIFLTYTVLNTIIQVSNLSKRFNNFIAVDDLSFTVNEGEVYGFLGQNGAGKSTTIRMILSLIKPSAGEINMFGYSLQRDREKILSKTGAVVERPDLYKYLSAYEHMRLFAALSGISLSRSEIMRQLAVVGLEKRCNDKVRVFSQGMKQRLGIAVALVHDPSLIILDEPTNGLDPQGIADMRSLILMLSKEQGKTVLVSSHLLSEIEQIADSMIIIDKGKKIVEGKVAELVNPSSIQLEIVALNSKDAELVIKDSRWASGLIQATEERLLIDVRKESIPELFKFLVEKDIQLINLRSTNTLESYFLSITKGHAV
jgi:ABC-type multidrug transport system ATPase subunit